MAAIEVGRVCIKTRGREAGKKAVVVDLEKDLAVIDGSNIRRKKCNTRHLIPTKEKIAIKKGASHDEVVKMLK